MQNKGHRRTAAEQAYHDKVRNAGCILTRSPSVHIDHLWGAKAKSNKVHIGEWAVIALHPDIHMDGKINRTTNEMAFYKEHLPQLICAAGFIACKKHLFALQLEVYLAKYKEPAPIPDDVLEAILNYRL